jgi:hypothetical protein
LVFFGINTFFLIHGFKVSCQERMGLHSFVHWESSPLHTPPPTMCS